MGTTTESSSLDSLNDERAGPLQQMTLSHLIEEVLSPQRDFGVMLTATRHSEGPEPICARNPGILYGLGNLVENAIDYAVATVEIDTSWTRDQVVVRITDDGPGFAADVLARLGDPYVRSRNAGRRSKSQEKSGLGLGMFIAKTLLERSGARLTMANRSDPDHGAMVTVSWPRNAFERDSARSAAPAQSRRQALQALQSL